MQGDLVLDSRGVELDIELDSMGTCGPCQYIRTVMEMEHEHYEHGIQSVLPCPLED